MLHIITKVKLFLSSISNDWPFWSVNHNSMSWNSELNVFLKKYNLLEKFLINYQTVYLEQKCIKLLNLVDNHYWQYYNELILTSRCGPFSPFLSLVILFSVLPSNFIASGVKSSRLHPFLILNVILVSILFKYIFTDGLYFLHVFFKFVQNNLKYLIQNMIHQVIQIYHSMLKQIF